ncbi:MAG: polyprenyl synthetase family protein [Clostridia bacterium]|nr:polyprenyl synthetase family protein [Clostridia bacterium]
MTAYKEKYDNYLADFETVLDGFCGRLDCKPEKLADSLKYSLKSGGKRLRPVLMFAVGELLGVERTSLTNYALALELIHTYSLIHDDLPEMDNDDYRRGRLTNHKVFGVGNAVLAGDGLLNTAYSLLFGECFNGNDRVSAAKFICDCAGINGMIAGQAADLEHENDTTVDENLLNFIYENKTAKLLIAAVVVPSILCGGKYYSELKTFGSVLGNLFQLTDDILDIEGSFEQLGKSTGKDSAEGKYTGVRLYGLDGSKVRADVLAVKCTGILEKFEGDTSFLKDLVSFVRQRIC